MVEGNLFVVDGQVESAEDVPAEISVWGTSSRAIDAYLPGETADLGDGETMAVQSNGDYVWEGDDDQISGRGQRVFVTAESPPEFTLANYRNVLFDPGNREGMAKAFFNTLTVTIPATIIPILIAAFAAYALAWMEFPGRALLVAAVVALLVVPLQLALIPLLSLHNAVGIGKGYLGVWLAHTGFGLPLAIYLLRNYMVGLPREVIENARVDGATEFQIFTRIILPLSFPALASFRDLPVPVDVERSAGGHGVSDRRLGRYDGDDPPDRGTDGHARRRLGNPGDLGLRVDRGSAGGVFHDAALSRARLARRFGEIGPP